MFLPLRPGWTGSKAGENVSKDNSCKLTLIQSSTATPIVCLSLLFVGHLKKQLRRVVVVIVFVVVVAAFVVVVVVVAAFVVVVVVVVVVIVDDDRLATIRADF